jgi:hypothetical protein
LAGLEVLAAHDGWRLSHQLQGPGQVLPEDVLSVASALVVLVLGLWPALGLAAALMATSPGRRGAVAGRLLPWCAPGLSRRWAAMLVGVAVGASVGAGPGVTTAYAAPARTAAPDPTGTRSATMVQGLPGFSALGVSGSVATSTTSGPPVPAWTPTRPRERPPASPGLVTGPVARRAPLAGTGLAGRPVVVHRGDTLWQIVQRWLGPGATEAEVSSAWPQWYAANRTVIGDNPALIQPGQLLHAPGTVDRATSHR